MTKLPTLLLALAPGLASAHHEPAHATGCPADRPCAQRPRPRLQPKRDVSPEIRRGGREDVPPPRFAPASPDDQWIGYIAQGEPVCPEAAFPRDGAGSWAVEQPFTAAWAGDLARYCFYRWVPIAEGAPPRVDLLPNLSLGGAPRQVLRLERDAEVTAPLGNSVTLPQAGWTFLAYFFSRQLDVANWFLPGLPGGAQRTRVAVIDGAQFSDYAGYPSTSRAGHAEGMGSVIRNTACLSGPTPGLTGETPCNNELVEVVSYLALPRLYQRGELVYDYVDGGYFGSQLEVAAAIAQAVGEWLEPPDGAARPHLILNLSLGWDADWSAMRPEEMRLGARMAYEAVRTAACHGALVIAAAGNLGDAAHTGPMFPAAWEGLTKSCPAGSPVAPAGVYDPLVHAVGGVDRADAFLAISRPEGIPRLVAPADHVAVRAMNRQDLPEGAPEPGTEVHTGTSVAAASVSAIAATLWSLRPELQSWEVMDHIYRSAIDLGTPARFGAGEPQSVRRVSHCRAVRLACEDELGLCPPHTLTEEEAQYWFDLLHVNPDYLVVPTCLDRPAGESDVLDVATLMALVDPDGDAQAPGEPLQACPESGCPGTTDLPLDVTIEPFAHPQPGATNCPFCALVRDSSGNWRAQGQLVNQGIVETLTSGKLEIFFSDGSVRNYAATSQMLAFQYFKAPFAFTPATLKPVKGRITLTSSLASYVSKDELLVQK